MFRWPEELDTGFTLSRGGIVDTIIAAGYFLEPDTNGELGLTGNGAITYTGAGQATSAINAAGQSQYIVAGDSNAHTDVSAVGAGGYGLIALGGVSSVVSGLGTGLLVMSGSGVATVANETIGTGAILITGSASLASGIGASGGGALALLGVGEANASINGDGAGQGIITGQGSAQSTVHSASSGEYIISGAALAKSTIQCTGGGDYQISGSGLASVVMAGVTLSGEGALSLDGFGRGGPIAGAVATGQMALFGQGTAIPATDIAAHIPYAIGGAGAASSECEMRGRGSLRIAGRAIAESVASGVAESNVALTGSGHAFNRWPMATSQGRAAPANENPRQTTNARPRTVRIEPRRRAIQSRKRNAA